MRFGSNNKALLATRALFSLTHKYGDILREGWKNMTECLLQLFKCQLLPETMMEAEDFIEMSGKVNLTKIIEKYLLTKIFVGELVQGGFARGEGGQRVDQQPGLLHRGQQVIYKNIW